MRPLAPSVARGRSRRIHRGGTEVRHGQCRVPKARRWVGRARWSIGGGYSPTQKNLKITPIQAAEPIDRIGDPSGEVLMGSLLI